MFTIAIILLILAFPLLLPNWTDAVVNIGRFRLGGSHHIIGGIDRPYLERWILWYGFGTLRLHKFHRGDDDRAPHDHPFWFITFPFRAYREKVFDIGENTMRIQEVKAFRFHFRPANHTHIVLDQYNRKPFWTFVVTGMHQQHWGFYPWNLETGFREYVYWKEWK